MFFLFLVLCFFIYILKSSYQVPWGFNQGYKKCTSSGYCLPDHEHTISLNLFIFSLISLSKDYFVYSSYTYFATHIPRNLIDLSIVILYCTCYLFKFMFSKYLLRTVGGESFSWKLSSRQGCIILVILTSTIIQEKLLKGGHYLQIMSLYMQKT